MNYKGYYFRICPNAKQKELINKSLGCSRFIYNYYLNKIKKELRDVLESYQERAKEVRIIINVDKS